MEFENGVSFYRGILCDTKRVGPLSQSSLEYHVSVEQTGSSVIVFLQGRNATNVQVG